VSINSLSKSGSIKPCSTISSTKTRTADDSRSVHTTSSPTHIYSVISLLLALKFLTKRLKKLSNPYNRFTSVRLVGTFKLYNPYSLSHLAYNRPLSITYPKTSTRVIKNSHLLPPNFKPSSNTRSKTRLVRSMHSYSVSPNTIISSIYTKHSLKSKSESKVFIRC
jgi:hypothetical protein